MSKNIIIQEGGVPRQLTADKLRTNQIGGGTCDWVPEDAVRLTTKSVNQNGTYTASDDGFYGYSAVTVSGVGVASGRGADGNDYIARTGSGGTLDVTKVPSSIKVTTPPTFTGAYIDGATIDYSGMIVTAYDKNGQSMGELQLSDLTLPVQNADYSQTTHKTGYGEATSDLPTNWAQPISVYNYIAYTEYTGNRYIAGNGKFLVLYGIPMQTYFTFLAVSSTPGVIGHIAIQDHETGYIIYEADIVATSNITIGGKTVYWSGTYSTNSLRYSDPIPEGVNNGGGPDANTIWTAIYGDIEEIGTGDYQTIPVQLQLPNGVVLQDTFEITVAATAGGGGTTEGGGGAGRND